MGCIMRSTTMTLRIEEDIKRRTESAAAFQHRSISEITREALTAYLDNFEKNQQEMIEAQAAMDDYVKTGIYFTGDAVINWINSWGQDNEKDIDPCHD